MECVASNLAQTFKFGYYTYQDIKQEAHILCIKALPRWDKTRSLYTFLYSHVRNRLCNLKRDNYERREPPCLTCPINAYHDCRCLEHENMMDCSWYNKWYVRNSAKRTLMTPSNLDNLYNCEPHSDFESKLEDQEFLDYVERELAEPFATNFKKLRRGEDISENERSELMEKVWQVKEDAQV